MILKIEFIAQLFNYAVIESYKTLKDVLVAFYLEEYHHNFQMYFNRSVPFISQGK